MKDEMFDLWLKNNQKKCFDVAFKATAKQKAKLVHYFSKLTLDMLNLFEETTLKDYKEIIEEDEVESGE